MFGFGIRRKKKKEGLKKTRKPGKINSAVENMLNSKALHFVSQWDVKLSVLGVSLLAVPT